MEIRSIISLELYIPEMVQNVKCMQYELKRILEIHAKNRGSPIVLSPSEHEAWVECDGVEYKCNITDEGNPWCYIPSVLTEDEGVKNMTFHIRAIDGIGNGEELTSSRFYLSVLPAEYNKAEIGERIEYVNANNN